MRRMGWHTGASAVIPPTFLLPEESAQLLQHNASLADERDRAVICKPTNSGGSKDIFIFPDAAAAVRDVQRCVACSYINRPLLIDGKKFDLRIFVLVAQGDSPLRAWVHGRYLVSYTYTASFTAIV